MKCYTADFETATWLQDETYVWAWATCEIGNEKNLVIDNNIDKFIKYIQENKNSKWYFHNLKFDGSFILYYLETHNYKHILDKKNAKNKTYTTLISEEGVFYNITIYFKTGKQVNKAEIFDSLKIIPFSVKNVAKTFNLEINKLELDYNTPRSRYHILTHQEKEYIKNDVLIMAKALNKVFSEDLTKMTQGANALHDFKKTLTKARYEHLFPPLDKELDILLRRSYKGGFTYLSPEFKEKTVGETTILDVNSLYPSVMKYKTMPIGDPIPFKGEYKLDKVYPLYIQNLTCSFDLKPNKIPIIQIKNNRSYIGNEYLTTSNGDIVNLTLTSIDLQLIKEHYNLTNITYEFGWKFKGMNNIFDDYINKWIERKNNGTKTNNIGQRTIAKLMLNSLYGKFSTALTGASKIPYLENGEIIRFKLGEEEDRKGLYIPIGSFITSYAREKTIRTSQKIMDYSYQKYGENKYIYSDTDSIHTLLSIEELKNFCEIDNIKLGAWKHEGTAKRAKFIRQKCYLEDIDGKINITCAGLPESCYNYVDWEKFKIGFSCPRKFKT